MGFGIVLATLMPQLGLAQKLTPASRQQVIAHQVVQGQSRKIAAQVKAERANVTLVSPSAATAKAAPSGVEVVNAVPKLNEKRLSEQELRELRTQLLQQR